MHDDELFTEREAAEFLRLSTRTLQRLKDAGPRKLRLTAHRIAYRRADLLAWINARSQHGAAKIEVGA